MSDSAATLGRNGTIAARGAPLRRVLGRLMVLGVAITFMACSILHRGNSSGAGTSVETSAEASSEASPSPEAGSADSAAPESNPGQGASPQGGASDANSPPSATVAISYAHKGDYLASLSVSKFNGAEMIESRNIDPQHVASIIRFDGGVPVWEIQASAGVFSKLPVVGAGDQFTVRSISYGKLPAHFTQVTPESGPPEPLEVGHYYIFTAQRASGALSYEAVRVESDGSLDGYDAEPRAGTSYVLCCNVNPDFIQPPAPVVPLGDSGAGP
jgi:hypothetical protein